MNPRARLLYLVLILGCAAGYGWVAWTINNPAGEVTVCLVKNVTGLPCPSCGSTRAVAALAQGDVYEALQWNPLGLFIAAVLVITPMWIGFDFTTGRQTLIVFVNRAERFLERRWVAIPAIGFVLANWIWNFSKNL